MKNEDPSKVSSFLSRSKLFSSQSFIVRKHIILGFVLGVALHTWSWRRRFACVWVCDVEKGRGRIRLPELALPCTHGADALPSLVPAVFLTLCRTFQRECSSMRYHNQPCGQDSAYKSVQSRICKRRSVITTHCTSAYRFIKVTCSLNNDPLAWNKDMAIRGTFSGHTLRKKVAGLATPSE